MMRLAGSCYRFFLLMLLAAAWGQTARAQTDSFDLKRPAGRQRSLFAPGIGLQHGFIFAHSPAVENTKGAHPTGLEAILGWQRTDSAVWALCNCYPRKGLLLAYYDYDNSILGKSATAAYFLEPVYKVGKNTFFSFRGATGLSYLTNPFDSLRNPSNRSYSTTISGYLLVGLGIWWRLSGPWWVYTSVNYQHQSNGSIRQPNKGINWPTAGVAVGYRKNAQSYYTGIRTKEKYWTAYGVRWDVGLFGVARKASDETGRSRRFPLVGGLVQAGKQVGRISALTMSAELYRDDELRMRLKQDSIAASPVKAGIAAGHEFLLGKFIFSQRLGIYLLDQTPYYDLLYHRWGLLYRMNRRFGIGCNLQAHRHEADFIDLRVVYSMQKNSR